MSNHVHVLLHVDVKQVMAWTDNEIVRRWHLLHKGTLLTQMFATGDTDILTINNSLYCND